MRVPDEVGVESLELIWTGEVVFFLCPDGAQAQHQYSASERKKYICTGTFLIHFCFDGENRTVYM
jgi:hypothetical protein